MIRGSLRNRLEAAVDAYRQGFAGQQRGTRDVAALDEIIAQARLVMNALERRVGALRPDERALFEEARSWVGMFTKERAAILAEKAFPERTSARQFIGEPGGRANLYMAMLRSRFHSDAQHVDVALLTEVIEGLKVCQRDMLARTPDIRETWMIENLDAVRANLAACTAQHDEVVRSWSSGAPAERKQFLMQLGLDLEHFLAWEAKFIAPGAQRPARLRHAATLYAAVTERVGRIGGLTGGEGDAISRMVERADSLLLQEQQLVAARAAGDDATAIAALDRELASVTKVYQTNFAGKPRDKVDLPLLRRVLYRTCSVAIEATELWNAHSTAETEAFRVRTRKRAYLYEDEEKAVAEAQSAKPPKRG